MNERLLKGKEAAEVVGTTEKTLATWRCKRQGPPFVKVGRSVRYRVSDLDTYIRGLEPKKPE